MTLAEKLVAPFGVDDIEWRVQQTGTGNNGVWARVLAYVTNRAIMERLDEVVGPEGWENIFTAGPGGGVLCGLTIHFESRSVTKWDGADNTNMEAVKGGLSGSMKRAAVQWGIGRYLYKLEAGWANVCENGTNFQSASQKSGTPAFRWNPPALPSWALPEGATQNTTTPTEAPQSGSQASPRQRQIPNAGGNTITVKQAGFLHSLIKDKSGDPKATEEAIRKKFGVTSFKEIPYDPGKALIDKYVEMPDKGQSQADDDLNLDDSLPF